MIYETLFVFFLILSAFFSASETAFLTINEMQIKKMLEKKEKGAKTIAKLKKKSHNVIIAILIGNNIANVTVSAIATHLSTIAYGSSGVGIAIGGITFLLLIFGEVTPKTIAFSKAKTFMKHSAKMIEFTCILFSPVIYLLSLISKNTTTILGVKMSKQKGLTEEELKSAVLIGEEKGIIDKHEKKIMSKLFDFSDTKVDEIMTPKSKVVMIDNKMNMTDFATFVKKHQYSRFPVYKEKEDNIIGIIYTKDVLAEIAANMKGTIANYIKKAYFVHENKEIGTLMEEMRKRQQHMSVVINEYGVVEGIVTLEDIIEEIVGEIEDEKDTVEKRIFKRKKEHLVVDGLTTIDELEEHGIKLPEGEYNTINGFLTKKADKLPGVGDVIKYKNYEMIIESVIENRVSKVLIKKKR
ncbi:MAG: HlyC/CorC family transporter [Candidatus Aenigmarchaeota archaeon]|nr:HlyC/CorC family transporter [Candidatus Aenigmarchaeota archaeon]